MVCERITDANREAVHALIQQRWYSTTMVIRGKEIEMTQVEGFCLREGETILGLAT